MRLALDWGPTTGPTTFADPRAANRFNGGPGCSSFDGSLMEVGPLRLVPGGDGKLKEVEGAWNEYANVVFSQSAP